MRRYAPPRAVRRRGGRRTLGTLVLQRICSADVAVPAGKVVYTTWLNFVKEDNFITFFRYHDAIVFDSR